MHERAPSPSAPPNRSPAHRNCLHPRATVQFSPWWNRQPRPLGRRTNGMQCCIRCKHRLERGIGEWNRQISRGSARLRQIRRPRPDEPGEQCRAARIIEITRQKHGYVSEPRRGGAE